MFASMRSRLVLVMIITVLGSVCVTLAALTVLTNPFARAGALQIAGTLVAVTSVLLVGALLLVTHATRPLGRMVQATRELNEGRHPDEAFEDLGDDTELRGIAEGFRQMAIRLREVDSGDRRFLMSISHELRTPLTAITGHAQALEDGVADNVEMRNRSLAVIRREAGRLDRLVEDIIDLARLRSNRFNIAIEGVYLDELGEHLTAIFEDRTNHPDVEVLGDFEHILLHSDGQRILQILRNLVNNGLRYATSQVRITGERVRGRVRVTVYNDGDPIPADMQEKIFEPFVGTKREGGMGLGLAIGRELSWALGGNLRCISSETGALFELTLPLEPYGTR